MYMLLLYSFKIYNYEFTTVTLATIRIVLYIINVINTFSFESDSFN